MIDHMNSKFSLHLSIGLLCHLVVTSLAYGAENELATQQVTQSAAVFWNLVIALLVIIVTAASAALPMAAMRQWRGGWRIAAIVPLTILGLWIAVIVVDRFENPDAQRLWALEIFAWAMLNMIYMVTVMTVKRVLDKAEQE